uniref:Uncharacterized protein n=1 Tax=Odontella aurita TaxID=265563 RepID=A0A7S4HIP7_9STRA|mmetsp:Transcript_10620/g.31375  ORF Transcript_10620/g.31375 Transcript_10620/m.31375 type:complete len:443 (+) Transcript_10620:273-1601(+)
MRWATTIVPLAATQSAIGLSLSGTAPLRAHRTLISAPSSPFSRPTNLFGPTGRSGRNFGGNDAAPIRTVDLARWWCPARGHGAGARTFRTSLPSAVVMGEGTDVEKDAEASIAAAAETPSATTTTAAGDGGGGIILVTASVLTKSLAFLAGVADVLCSTRHECYANMMTGNTVKFATAVAERRSIDALFSLSVLSSYVLGFGMYRIADRLVAARRRRRRRRKSSGSSSATAAAGAGAAEELEEEDPSPTPVVVAPGIFAAFALYDALYHRFGGPSSTISTRWIVPLLAAASGTVNAAGSEATGAVANMMTGNLQKVSNYAADAALRLVFGGPRPNENLRDGARKSAGVVGCFAAGIAASSFFAARTGIAWGGGGGPFTMLGGAYALLLLTFDRPVLRRGRSSSSSPRAVWRSVRKQISWGLSDDAPDEPCELDALESECSVP